MVRLLCFVVTAMVATGPVAAADATRRVVIYAETATEVRADTATAADLWVTLADLTTATKWTVKPEGVCSATECIPIPAEKRKEFFAERSGASWFNLSAFARLLKLPVAHDGKHGVWYFGPRPQAASSSLLAPDFTLPDHTGKPRHLAEFRGKKVLLLTWASW